MIKFGAQLETMLSKAEPEMTKLAEELETTKFVEELEMTKSGEAKEKMVTGGQGDDKVWGGAGDDVLKAEPEMMCCMEMISLQRLLSTKANYCS